MNGRTLALAIFGLLVVAGLVLAYWYGRRSRGAAEFWAASGEISSRRNALATVGDFMSGSALLGGVGLLFLFGFDGTFYLVLPLVAWIPVMLLIAERLRNLGQFTLTDVLARRFPSPAVRPALAASTLVISGVYLLAQLVVAGDLFTLLSGVDYAPAVIATGVIIVCYVATGGMRTTTVIQAAKAILLLGVLLLIAVLLLVKFGGNVGNLIAQATAPVGRLDPLRAGNLLHSPWDTLSVGLALTLGVAGLPHVMMRFFTVPGARDARRSVTTTVWIITGASVLIAFIGLGASALLRGETAELAATGGNLVTPRLAELLGGDKGSVGGAVVLGVVCAVAFATVVAVVSGLLLNASSTVVRDLWNRFERPHGGVPGGDVEAARASEREVVRGRVAAVAIGAAVVLLAIGLGPDFNATKLVTLAFGVAASANFPVLLLTLTWRRFTDVGALTGLITGLVTAVTLMALGPLWPGSAPVIGLSDPTVIAFPLAFVGCLAGTLLSRRRASGTGFDQLRVTAEVGRALTPAGTR